MHNYICTIIPIFVSCTGFLTDLNSEKIYTVHSFLVFLLWKKWKRWNKTEARPKQKYICKLLDWIIITTNWFHASCKLNQELITTKSQPACFKSLSTRLNQFGTKATLTKRLGQKSHYHGSNDLLGHWVKRRRYLILPLWLPAKQKRMKLILSWAKLETTDHIKEAAVFKFNECYLNETWYYLFK